MTIEQVNQAFVDIENYLSHDAKLVHGALLILKYMAINSGSIDAFVQISNKEVELVGKTKGEFQNLTSCGE